MYEDYVKQILSQLMAVSDNVVVNRCKKDRDWMVAAVNQAFVKNKVCRKTETSMELLGIKIALQPYCKLIVGERISSMIEAIFTIVGSN